MITVYLADPDKFNRTWVEREDTITWPENGHGQNHIRNFAEKIKNGDCIITSSELVFLVLRRRIAEGNLQAEDIKFILMDDDGEFDVIRVDSYGQVTNKYPEIFSNEIEETRKILEARFYRC